MPNKFTGIGEIKLRGGARAGSGRKATGSTRRKITVTVSHEADDKIRAEARRGSLTVSEIADGLFKSLP